MTDRTLLLLLLFCFCTLSTCLYEDQIGKFDWKRELVGNPRHVLVNEDSSGLKRIILSTEQNVLAALAPGNGAVLWRRVLESGTAGRIHALLETSGGDMLSYSGRNLLRLWNPSSGMMISETQLNMKQHKHTDVDTAIYVSMVDDQLMVYELESGVSHVHRVPLLESRIVDSIQLNTQWFNKHSRCAAGPSGVLCVSGDDGLMRFHSSQMNASQFISNPLPADLLSQHSSYVVNHVDSALFSLDWGSGVLLLVHADSSRLQLLQKLNAHVLCTATPQTDDAADSPLLLRAGTVMHEQLHTTVEFCVLTADSDEVLSSRRVTMTTTPRACHVVMTSRAEGVASAARLLLVGADRSISLAQEDGGVLWTREESLASIRDVQVVDLPMSQSDVSIEEEFQQWDAGMLESLLRRMTSQWHQLSTSLMTRWKSSGDVIRRDSIVHPVRDAFNLNKMLLVATTSGKVFGIRSETGDIAWSHHTLLESGETVVLLTVQRGTAHFPHLPVAALLTSRQLYTLNPITGTQLSAEKLHYRPLQASTLPLADGTHLKPLVVLDTAGDVHVYPESAGDLVKSVCDKLYFHSTDVSTGVARGFAVNRDLVAVETWRADFSAGGSVRIRQVVGKSSQERVHSQGRVLSDRSVLYKYTNPNLQAVLTEGADSTHKHSVWLHLLDTVTGHVVYSQVQRRVRCPCHVVHSENWLLYSVYNERHRRTELTSIELYEGKTQANDTAFSSFEYPSEPMVERQSYIFPTQIETMRETITEKGITTKFLLFALPSGGIIELNRALLDPRRPLSPSPTAAQLEGLPPYMPELQLPSVAVINYNRSLQGVTSLHTWPSGLESTCLVFAHGLDLYWTRVFPSKMFDQLKDDFDSSFIVLVLSALLVVALVSRRLSQHSALKQAWK